MLYELIKLIEEKTISTKQAKEVLYEALNEKKDPINIINEKQIKQIGSEEDILKVIDEVLNENPSAIGDYKNGKTNIVDYLVGQVMKKTKGQANPTIAREKMIEKLEN